MHRLLSTLGAVSWAGFAERLQFISRLRRPRLCQPAFFAMGWPSVVHHDPSPGGLAPRCRLSGFGSLRRPSLLLSFRHALPGGLGEHPFLSGNNLRRAFRSRRRHPLRRTAPALAVSTHCQPLQGKDGLIDQFLLRPQVCKHLENVHV